MYTVYNFKVDPERSEVLWEADFSGGWQKDWEISRGEGRAVRPDYSFLD